VKVSAAHKIKKMNKMVDNPKFASSEILTALWLRNPFLWVLMLRHWVSDSLCFEG
jgi:hypothetical protein